MRGNILLNCLIIILLPVTIYAIRSPLAHFSSVQAQRFKPLKESETTDPYILHLRTAINGYLAGTNDGISLPEFVVKPGKTDKGMVLGLAAFDRTYYGSEFTVIKMEKGPSYGQIITIFFNDKPDKMFDAWVYTKDNGEYDLRGFWENEKSVK